MLRIQPGYYESSKIKYLKKKIASAEQTIKFQDFARPLSIGIVDIVDSTSIASKLSNLETAKYYSIFLNSMSKIVS